MNEPQAAARPDRKPRAEAPALVAISAIAIAEIAAHLLALRLPPGALWGADSFVFLPRAALIATLVLAGSTLALLWRSRFDAREAARESAAGANARRIPGLETALLVVLSAAAFWVFRAGHALLGDGIPILGQLSAGGEIHPREPLASWIQERLFGALGPLFAQPGRTREAVVRDVVATGSALSGVVFVLAARALGRELVRLFPASAPERERKLGTLLALAIVSQGSVQIFFGYIENYSFTAAAVALYLLAALRFLGARAPLALPLAAFGLAFACHLSSVVLAPSALVLALAALLDPNRRAGAIRDVLLLAVLAGLLVAALALGPARYSAISNLGAMLSSGRAGADYLFSAAHLRDFFSEHLRLGPFALFGFALLAAPGALARSRPLAARVFLLALGLAAVAACWQTPDLPLGYARDWDLFTPLGVALAGAALALAMASLSTPRARGRAVSIVLAASLFSTVPWIALNTSETRSVERFKTLPLGQGRVESTIAYWYFQHGDLALAKSWIRKSILASPENSRAVDLFGRIALAERDPVLAARAYRIAVGMRPDKPDYRMQLVFALLASGEVEEGLAHSDTLLAMRPEDPLAWAERALLLRAAGQPDAARVAAARADGLRPGATAFADSLARGVLPVSGAAR